MHMLDGLAGSACGIRHCLRIVSLCILDSRLFPTRFTTIPPSEWQTKIRGRCVAFSSCLLHLSRYSCLNLDLLRLTSRSATNSATNVCACCRIRSDEVLPNIAVTFALYPYVRIREFFRFAGRRSGSLSHIFSDPSVVHVPKGSPLSPCTATTLCVLADLPTRGDLFDVLYNRMVASIQLSQTSVWNHVCLSCLAGRE